MAALFAGFHASAQETVSMGSNYANENYYSLSSGDENAMVRDNWDIAFASDGLGGSSSTIRINGSIGTELYLFSTDTADWGSLDTTGFQWSQIINSETDWSTGAFQNQTPASGFDLGWGTYNSITHIVSGDRIFVLKLANGGYKKLIIDQLTGGVFTFHYADLDGSNLVETSVSKSNYAGKNFGYYSLQNNVSLDREPLANSWDLLFTKYVVDLGGGYLYGVTGVLANAGLEVAQANNVNNVLTESWQGHSFEDNIGTIGWDWKSFNMTTFTYEIEDSLVYFIEDEIGNIYKVIFTGFGGSSTGDFIFTKELVNAVGLTEFKNQILNVYPNPASGIINVIFSSNDNEVALSIVDLSGRTVASRELNVNIGMAQESIEIDHLNSGVYLLTLRTSKGIETQKIIIR
jgi:hypothetical protein